MKHVSTAFQKLQGIHFTSKSVNTEQRRKKKSFSLFHCLKKQRFSIKFKSFAFYNLLQNPLKEKKEEIGARLLTRRDRSLESNETLRKKDIAQERLRILCNGFDKKDVNVRDLVERNLGFGFLPTNLGRSFGK